MILATDRESFDQGLHQTSADKDTECSNTSVSFLSGGQTDNAHFFQKSGQKRDRKNPDRHASDSLFLQNSDRLNPNR